jgi:hypothetical protein
VERRPAPQSLRQQPRHRPRVILDDQVEVARRLAPQQQVAHDATDEPDAVDALERVDHGMGGGQRLNRVNKICHRGWLLPSGAA